MFNTQVVIRALEFVTLRVVSSFVMRNNNIVSGADVIPTVYAAIVVFCRVSVNLLRVYCEAKSLPVEGRQEGRIRRQSPLK